MKKIFLLLFNLILLVCNAQEQKYIHKQSVKTTHKMDLDTTDYKVHLSPNLSLLQKKKKLENPKRIRWELYIQNKKEAKTILLDSLSILIPPPDAILPSVTSDNTVLEMPQLLSGIKNDKTIYPYIFKERALWLYKYNFIEENFESERIKVFNMLPGSVDNFGDPDFDIVHFKIFNDDYFNISHYRVLGEIEMLVRLDKDSFKINKLTFSKTKTKNKIKDKDKIFRTLDLEKNKEKVAETVRKVLSDNRYLKKEADFKYLGNIDISDYYDDDKYKLRTTGVNYFFYISENLKTNIIRYNNYENEWIIGDYKEEELIEK